MPISRPSESNLRVPHLQSLEPSVGSVPWAVPWPSESSLRGDCANIGAERRSQSQHRVETSDTRAAGYGGMRPTTAEVQLNTRPLKRCLETKVRTEVVPPTRGAVLRVRLEGPCVAMCMSRGGHVSI